MAAVSSSMVTGASQYAAGAAKASSIKSQARFESAQAEFNARQLDKQVEKSIKRGETAAVKNETEIKLLIGEQKASLAAQGIIIDDGIAQALQDQSKEIGLKDSATIRNNAQREAMGFRFQALDMRTKGSFITGAAGVNAAAAQLSGSISALQTTSSGFFDSLSKVPKKKSEVPIEKEEIFTGNFDQKNLNKFGSIA